MSKDSRPLSIERILQNQGFGSRKLCRILVRNGDVAVNGVLCEDPDEVEFYGLSIKTDKGEIVIDYRNSSNGYYGGSLCWPSSLDV